jgi:hypothetical protein
VDTDGFAVDASLIAAGRQQAALGSEQGLEAGGDQGERGSRRAGYLATLDDAAFGAASPVTPKFISRSDPAAQWIGAHNQAALATTWPSPTFALFGF